MTMISYPPKLDDESEHPAFMQFKFFDRGSIEQSAEAETLNLYMPEMASQPSTVDWGAESLGMIGKGIAGTLKNVGSADGFMSALSQYGDNLRGSAGGFSIEDTAGAAALKGLTNINSSAASLFGGQVSAETLIGTMGLVANPYLTMIFKGINFREFQFNFKFVPFRESDCDLIDKIINLLRSSSVPDNESINRHFLGYPKECEIKYIWRGAENPFIHKFKRSVCTGIDVDYTPNGIFSVMRNGFPTQITVQTKWKEIELVLRRDITEGGY